MSTRSPLNQGIVDLSESEVTFTATSSIEAISSDYDLRAFLHCN